MATYKITTKKYYPKDETKTELVKADRVEMNTNEHGYVVGAKFYRTLPTIMMTVSEELVLFIQSPTRIEKVEDVEVSPAAIQHLWDAIERLESLAGLPEKKAA